MCESSRNWTKQAQNTKGFAGKLEILHVIYWTGLFLLVYPFLIYPLLLKVLAKLFNANRNLSETEEDWPSVTFIISAYNEEHFIEQKLKNAVELEYPQDGLEIMEGLKDGELVVSAGASRLEDGLRVKLLKSMEK